MKTGNIKLFCPKCSNKKLIKKGFYKSKKNQLPLRIYQCKECKHKFTRNSVSASFKQKRPDLNKKIMKMYCEGNTLRGISRLLDISYNTVIRKFLFMANLARDKHLQKIVDKEIITTYVQFDEMETFEHTKRKPLGIELAIRPKTYEILSAKVCRIPIKALSVSKKQIIKYNSKTNRSEGLTNMLIEVKKCLNPKYSVMSCDGSKILVKFSKQICDKSLIETYVNDYAGMWRLNHICAKLRQRLSRLKRKTWATTKKASRLQNHLDLFIACQNNYKLEF